jgi:DNA-binding SARP family transcriptional activator/tetratricopeptide (TPR) repeat protein
MEFLLLGPVELCAAGRAIDTGSVKERCVLALLALHAGSVMSAANLTDLVWDGDPPSKAREGLAVYVTRIRRILRDHAAGSASITAQCGGYRLDADHADIDLFRFRGLREQASQMAARAELGQAAELYRQGEQLWRGEALAGLRGSAIERVRQWLQEERWAAITQRLACDLAGGRHAAIISEIRQLSALRPLDESLAVILMTALFRCGRASDALRVYRETRALLADEQGMEPGYELSELHARILRGDPALALIPASPPLGGAAALCTIPPQAGGFTGRLAELDGLREGGTVQLITGMPGIGKTALAIQAAHAMAERFPDARLFLSLSAHDAQHPPLDPAEALHHLLRMLGIPASRIPREASGRSALWKAELARRRMIAILDDAASLEQVRPLLPVSGPGRVLITSRSRMDGLGQVPVVQLDVLEPADAVRLFITVSGGAAADGTAGPEQIARLCGRLPLAIQLAARRLRGTPGMQLGELAAELSAGSAGLPDGGPFAREIMAAFDMSYLALPGRTQWFFRVLGLHPGREITEHSAAALAGASLSEAGADLDVLIGRNLLEAAGRCFSFHDLTRWYAGQRAMRDDPEHDRRVALGRLLDYYLQAANRCNGLLYPDRWQPAPPTAAPVVAVPVLATAASAMEWMEREWLSAVHAVRYAASHERNEQCSALAGYLAGYMNATGRWKPAAEAHALALRACQDLDDRPGIARASIEMGWVLGQSGDLPGAFRHAEHAAGIFRSLGDSSGQARALDYLGTLHRYAARYRESLAYHREASELYRAGDDQRGLADTLNHIAISCYHLGRYHDVLEGADAAMLIYRRLGDRRGEAGTLNNLGTMQRILGYHRDAMSSYQDSLAIFEDIGGEQHQAKIHENIGCTYHYKHDYQRALASYRRALAMFREIGDLPGECSALNEIGVAMNDLDDHGDALAHHRQASAIAADLGDLYEQVIALKGTGDALCGLDRREEAASQYQQALLLAREISEPFLEGKVLDGMAMMALRDQDHAKARICWRQALDIFQHLGVPEAEAIRLRLETFPP